MPEPLKAIFAYVSRNIAKLAHFQKPAIHQKSYAVRVWVLREAIVTCPASLTQPYA